MKSYAFLFWAYNVVWVGLAVYLWRVMGRLSSLNARLEAIERAGRSPGHASSDD